MQPEFEANNESLWKVLWMSLCVWKLVWVSDDWALCYSKVYKWEQCCASRMCICACVFGCVSLVVVLLDEVEIPQSSSTHHRLFCSAAPCLSNRHTPWWSHWRNFLYKMCVLPLTLRWHITETERNQRNKETPFLCVIVKGWWGDGELHGVNEFYLESLWQRSNHSLRSFPF